MTFRGSYQGSFGVLQGFGGSCAVSYTGANNQLGVLLR